MEPGTNGHPLQAGTPLFDVRFVVLDVETTGGAPDCAALTEIGAAAFRGGECLGIFDTLVHPGCPVPPFITELTGITDAMVADAPSVETVLPDLVRFLDGAVLVGHNVGFDIGFLDAALGAQGRPVLEGPVVDTLALARRLVRDSVPDCALHTLAGALHLEHRPAHRALADALATADLLHRLIEAATGYDVFTLGDLLAVPERLTPMPRAGELLAAS
ncbi:MAG TPA: exonuclease domain-containing protein [Acidimicrobiales bacterium]|nr:exonuclease domain-containing protein [Acidimicrobiales bacterium]